MGWFVRVDRFTDTHLGFSQEDTDSCGLACAKMMVFKINKLQPGKAALTTEKNVEKIYKKYDSTAVNVGSEGVFFHMMHKVLNELRIGTWAHAKPAPGKIPQLLLDKMGTDVVGMGPIVNALTRGYPVMLKVAWSSGSHAVVVDTINKLPVLDQHWLSICDTADGDVHITEMTKGHAISYVGSNATISVNLWDSPKHKYGPKALKGTVTDLIYRVN
jgi:hypothetical protein